MIDRDDITGLILAGGRGSRMGGVDKGLQAHLGMPLAMHAVLRLSPQVGHIMINANRNLAHITGLQAFDGDCRRKLEKRIPKELPALEAILKAFR